MKTCKAVLRHPVTNAIMMKCDLEENSGHSFHHDEVIDVIWKRPYEDALVPAYPANPKIYVSRKAPYPAKLG